MATKTAVKRQTNEEKERNYRIEILNSILTTPHRDMAKIEGLHTDVLKNDPLFYGHLAAWYCNPANGSIRDHKKAFVGNLLTSHVEEHRDAGHIMVQDFPPEMVADTVRFVLEDLSRWKKKGLPRSTRKALLKFLKAVESNENRFDGAAVRNRKNLLYLYTVAHIAPGERARAILFDENPPEGSAPWVVRQFGKIQDPVEQATLIVKHKIPYPVASTIIQKMTPAVLVALIESMSAQELITNMNSLKKHGAMDNADVAELIKNKLKKAPKDKKVSMMKTRKAAAISGVMMEELEEVGDKILETNKAKITRATALLIDASGSMDVAIDMGVQTANILGAACQNGLFVYAFNDMPYPITPGSKTPKLSDWEKATRHITAGGSTSIGCPLKNMIRNNEYVEQFVIITDEAENAQPRFADIYEDYCAHFANKPSVWIVHVGGGGHYLENALKAKGVEVGCLTVNGADYYSLPELLSMISKPGVLDLLIDIMSYPLPVRYDKNN